MDAWLVGRVLEVAAPPRLSLWYASDLDGHEGDALNDLQISSQNLSLQMAQETGEVSTGDRPVIAMHILQRGQIERLI